MIAWLLLISIPLSIVVLIIWDAENFEQRSQRSGAGARISSVSVASVLVAICSALFAGASYFSSTDLAQKSLVAVNRPWVKVDIQVAGPIIYNVNGANFTLSYSLKNIGHSPAVNVGVFPRLVYGLGYTNNRAEMMKDISARKMEADGPGVGFSLFPDETIVQNIIVTMSNDEIKGATRSSQAIYPSAVGSVIYRMALDDMLHQTGFIVQIRRSDRPTPFTTEKNRLTGIIWADEGDLPAADVRLVRSYIDGGYAD
jgi:hypothetical protein